MILDESTDVTDKSHLLFFTWGMNAKSEVTEELTSMNSPHGTTTNKNVLKNTVKYLKYLRKF